MLAMTPQMTRKGDVIGKQHCEILPKCPTIVTRTDKAVPKCWNSNIVAEEKIQTFDVQKPPISRHFLHAGRMSLQAAKANRVGNPREASRIPKSIIHGML
jgi:hypothetical protein